MAVSLRVNFSGGGVMVGMKKNVLIVGVSSGIGHELASHFLSRGYIVVGMSRNAPEELLKHPDFSFTAIDLEDSETVISRTTKCLTEHPEITHFQYVFMNAGRFSQQITNMENVPLDDLKALMQINVWGHKLILDVLLIKHIKIDICMFSSSIAGVRARAGNSGYAISKAAMNMMAKLYALERPDIFFLVLGLCNVDTFLSQTILTLPLEGDFPEIAKLRERGKSLAGYIVSPKERVKNITRLLAGDIKNNVSSGDFIEIRSLI